MDLLDHQVVSTLLALLPFVLMFSTFVQYVYAISMLTPQGGVQLDKGRDRYRMVLVMEDHSILAINQGALIVLTFALIVKSTSHFTFPPSLVFMSEYVISDQCVLVFLQMV